MHRDLFCLLFIGNAKMAGEVPNPGASVIRPRYRPKSI
jgi:hypothetical protein